MVCFNLIEVFTVVLFQDISNEMVSESVLFSKYRHDTRNLKTVHVKKLLSIMKYFRQRSVVSGSRSYNSAAS